MVFFGGGIISLCGGGLGGERAEVDFSALVLDSCFPFSLGFVPFEALVFRAGF